MNNDCLTEENLRLFLAGKVSDPERKMREPHLADCADCRRRLSIMFSENAEATETFSAPSSVKEKVKALPEKQAGADKIFASGRPLLGRRRNLWQWAFAASLLVCFGLAGFYVLRYQPSNTTDTLRNGSAAASSLKLLSPASGANLSGQTIEFRWERVTNAKSNTLAVLDEKGDIIMQQSTTQESLSLNTSNLIQGKHYFWFVKAKLADGTVIDSDTAKFLFVK